MMNGTGKSTRPDKIERTVERAPSPPSPDIQKKKQEKSANAKRIKLENFTRIFEIMMIVCVCASDGAVKES